MKTNLLLSVALVGTLQIMSVGLALAQDLYVGSNSSGQTTNFSSGTHSYDNTYVGFGTNDSNNILSIGTTGTVLINTDSLVVGYSGSGNSLVISNKGQAVDVQGYIGYSASNNSALVTGTGSLWGNSFDLIIGNNASINSLVISNKGQVIDFVGYVGFASSSNNSAVVTGTGSLWSNNYLYFGNYGTGNSLVISNSGHVVDGYGAIGNYASSSNNSVLVTGKGSLWSNTNDFHFGSDGGGNSLVISKGGRVVDSNGYIGANSSNNSALVTGKGSLWNNSFLDLGYSGSGNSLLISNGGRVVDSNGYIGLYSSNNSTLVTGTGSVWSNSSGLIIGFYSGNGTLTVANGGTIAAKGITIASLIGSSGTVNIGTFGGNDTAGTLVTPTIAFGSGSGTLNFNQSDRASLTSTISGAGIVQQLGHGITLLAGSNSYSGGTIINVGTLQLGNNVALGTGTLEFGDGTLSPTKKATGLSNSISFNAAGATIANASAFTLSGNLSGVDGFTKNGVGGLMLTGTNSYSGETLITQGNLSANSLGSGAVIISPAKGKTAGFTDTLDSGTLSLGALTLNGGSRLTIENPYSTITSTGALSIVGNQDFIYLSGAWTNLGTYQLIIGTTITGSGLATLDLTETFLGGKILKLGKSTDFGGLDYTFTNTATAIDLTISAVTPAVDIRPSAITADGTAASGLISVEAVPEPSTYALFCIGALLLAVAMRRRQVSMRKRSRCIAASSHNYRMPS